MTAPGMVWTRPRVRVRARSAARRPASLGIGLDELGQAEVEELGVAVAGDHDVVGLDVAVEDAGVVGLGQALGDLEGDLDRAQEVELAVGDEPADGPAVDVLHGDEEIAVDLVDVVDLGDGRMVRRPRPSGPRGGGGSGARDRRRGRA